ncbi:MAG: hypothetical protein QNJ13_18260 [Paracoccaceae bacterium]|nr:hypothetical protein [Paracoccaceae bacterium]
MERRTFIALSGVSLLAACAAAEPLVSPEVARGIAIQDIRVEASQFAGVTGRPIEVTTEEVISDVDATLQWKLASRTTGSRPARLEVSIASFDLRSRGEAFVPGAPNSTLRAMVRVTDMETGEVIVAPTEVTGTGSGLRIPGPLGAVTAATTRPVDEDYEATIVSFAESVEERLYPDV